MFETSRKQKEKRILNLHNEGYSIRDIAMQEHISFRDIRTIVQRELQSQEASERQIQQAHTASQAYSLFLKGKSPIEVAIELKLRQPEVLDLYSEYLKLVQTDKLQSVYEEVKDDIEYFVKLYRTMKASGISLAHVERLVRIANDDLPSVELTFQLANKRVTELQGDIRNSTFTFQSLSDGISSMNATIRSLETERQNVQEEIDELYQKRMKLQGFVRYFENNNERFLHITKLSEEIVRSILSENKLFLRLAVQSLIGLIANDSAKYAYGSVADRSSSSHINETPPTLPIQTSQKADWEGQKLQQQPLLTNDGLEMLVQEAEKNLLNNLVKQFAPTIIALLMLILPKSHHSLSLAPEEL